MQTFDVFIVFVSYNEDEKEELDGTEYSFQTEAEKDAFLEGVRAMRGYADYRLASSEEEYNQMLLGEEE